jgi:hypothetical protein
MRTAGAAAEESIRTNVLVTPSSRRHRLPSVVGGQEDFQRLVLFMSLPSTVVLLLLFKIVYCNTSLYYTYFTRIIRYYFVLKKSKIQKYEIPYFIILLNETDVTEYRANS